MGCDTVIDKLGWGIQLEVEVQSFSLLNKYPFN